jgi:hypothetical protein
MKHHDKAGRVNVDLEPKNAMVATSMPFYFL